MNYSNNDNNNTFSPSMMICDKQQAATGAQVNNKESSSNTKSFFFGDLCPDTIATDENCVDLTSPLVKAKPNYDNLNLFADIVATRKPVVKRRKRNPWTTEEDKHLIKLIKASGLENTSQGVAGGENFNKIATELGTGRTGKQCRDRWNNQLRNGIKKGNWTEEEEELIKDLYSTFGPKWTTMSKVLSNRTDNDIKNKWYAMKRKEERLGLREAHRPIRVKKSILDSIDENETFDPRDWGYKPTAV